MHVSLLYFDDCPNWQVALARLTEALRVTGRTDQIVDRRLITTDAEAQAARFRGSPTILIDGEDPFADDVSRSFGLTCRVYPGDHGLSGAPTVDQLVAALRARA